MEYSPELEEQFSSRRDTFGIYAVGMLDYFCNPAFSKPPADALAYEDDFLALGDLYELESLSERLYDPLLAADYTCRLLEHFEGDWRRFQAALPFSEPERRWFLGLDYDAKSYDTADVSERKLSRHEANIVSAGVHTVVTGRDLLRRWLSWRRETDEYEGQDTLDVAREALKDLHDLVAPNEPLPDAYQTLRGLSTE